MKPRLGFLQWLCLFITLQHRNKHIKLCFCITINTYHGFPKEQLLSLCHDVEGWQCRHFQRISLPFGNWSSSTPVHLPEKFQWCGRVTLETKIYCTVYVWFRACVSVNRALTYRWDFLLKNMPSYHKCTNKILFTILAFLRAMLIRLLNITLT